MQINENKNKNKLVVQNSSVDSSETYESRLVRYNLELENVNKEGMVFFFLASLKAQKRLDNKIKLARLYAEVEAMRRRITIVITGNDDGDSDSMQVGDRDIDEDPFGEEEYEKIVSYEIYSTVLFFVVILMALVVVMEFVRVPTINGNSGSWTNSDDTKGEEQEARKRRHKEAKNRVHSKNAEKTKIQNGPVEKIEETPKTEKVEIKIPCPKHYLYDSFLGVRWGGKKI